MTARRTCSPRRRASRKSATHAPFHELRGTRAVLARAGSAPPTSATRARTRRRSPAARRCRAGATALQAPDTETARRYGARPTSTPELRPCRTRARVARLHRTPVRPWPAGRAPPGARG